MLRVLHGQVYLEDTDSDGIFNIHRGDQVYDESGFLLSTSQALNFDASLGNEFAFVDSGGIPLNHELSTQGVALGFLASPPPVPQTTSPLSKLKGTAALVAVIAGGAFLVDQFFGKKSQMGPVTPGVYAVEIEIPLGPTTEGPWRGEPVEIDPVDPDTSEDFEWTTSLPVNPYDMSSDFIIYNSVDGEGDEGNAGTDDGKPEEIGELIPFPGRTLRAVPDGDATVDEAGEGEAVESGEEPATVEVVDFANGGTRIQVRTFAAELAEVIAELEAATTQIQEGNHDGYQTLHDALESLNRVREEFDAERERLSEEGQDTAVSALEREMQAWVEGSYREFYESVSGPWDLSDLSERRLAQGTWENLMLAIGLDLQGVWIEERTRLKGELLEHHEAGRHEEFLETLTRFEGLIGDTYNYSSDVFMAIYEELKISLIENAERIAAHFQRAIPNHPSMTGMGFGLLEDFARFFVEGLMGILLVKGEIQLARDLRARFVWAYNSAIHIQNREMLVGVVEALQLQMNEALSQGDGEKAALLYHENLIQQSGEVDPERLPLLLENVREITRVCSEHGASAESIDRIWNAYANMVVEHGEGDDWVDVLQEVGRHGQALELVRMRFLAAIASFVDGGDFDEAEIRERFLTAMAAYEAEITRLIGEGGDQQSMIALITDMAFCYHGYLAFANEFDFDVPNDAVERFADIMAKIDGPSVRGVVYMQHAGALEEMGRIDDALSWVDQAIFNFRRHGATRELGAAVVKKGKLKIKQRLQR